MDTKRAKRPVLYDPDPPAPLVQVMPNQAARIDPSVVPQLTCYMLALKERYDRTARMTLAGYTGKARQIRQGQIAHAQVMLEAIDAICRTFSETIDLRAYDRAKAEWDAALRDIGGEG